MTNPYCIQCPNMWNMVWSCRLSLCLSPDIDRGLCWIGLSSHRQICLNLPLNNSVDLFYWPDYTSESKPAVCSDIHFISSTRSPVFFLSLSPVTPFFYAEVTEPQLLKSSILSSRPPLLSSPVDPLRRSEGQLFDKSARRNSLLLNPFIFIHTNTGLELLAAP